MSGQQFPGGMQYDARQQTREQAVAAVLQAIARVWDQPDRLDRLCRDLTRLAGKVQQ